MSLRQWILSYNTLYTETMQFRAVALKAATPWSIVQQYRSKALRVTAVAQQTPCNSVDEATDKQRCNVESYNTTRSHYPTTQFQQCN
jgi:hypothetical protein